MAPARPGTVAEAYLAALKTRGVDWIFGNAGTDFAPVIEAVAANADGRLPMPTSVEVVHETVAVAMAHGYWLATGRPQCAMVHVNVGVANAIMGTINASRGNVPLLLASGRTPITESGRLGSRNAPIHWGQEMFDQAGMLREVVKWDSELRVGEQVVDQVERSLAVAAAEPKGPVYLSLPRELLAESLPESFCFDAAGLSVPSPPHPDPAAIDAAARAIAEATSPVVVVSGGGPGLFDVLGPFAERFAVPVVQFWRTRTAISTSHPFYAGESPGMLVSRADVVIVLDALVPWLPDRVDLQPGCRVIQIAPDPLFSDIPLRSFPADIAVTTTSELGIAGLAAALDAAGAASSEAVRTRRTELVPELAARREREVAAGNDPGGSPMSPAFMSRTISDAVGEDATIVNELGLATAVMDFAHPDSFFGPSIAGGLGWGGGAAVGVKLADPDRLTLWTTGDGSYVFSNPAAVHHAAASLGLGLVTVVADNRVWNAVRRSTLAVYPNGAAAAAETMPFSSLEPAPDYPKIVEAYGGHGEQVSSPDDLRSALRRAIEVADSGRQALVAVRVGCPDTIEQ